MKNKTIILLPVILVVSIISAYAKDKFFEANPTLAYAVADSIEPFGEYSFYKSSELGIYLAVKKNKDFRVDDISTLSKNDRIIIEKAIAQCDWAHNMKRGYHYNVVWIPLYTTDKEPVYYRGIVRIESVYYDGSFTFSLDFAYRYYKK